MSATAEAIPDGLVEFRTAAGTSFKLDLLAACEAADRVAAECAERQLVNFEYAEKFAAWVEAEAGAVLTKAEADFVFDRVRVLYAKKKHERVAALLPGSGGSGPTSPSSTALTPAG